MFSVSAFLGLDLGGTSIKWARLGSDGALLDQGAVPTPADGVERTLAAIAEIVASWGSSAGPGRRIGLAVPGSVDHATSRVLNLPNIPGDWAGVLVAGRLAAATGRDWRVVNDARAFAFGELRMGAARDDADALFVTLGTGVGGAMAVHGRLEMGTAGLIGELGHVSVETGGRPCGCGHRGCLEAYAGAAGMLAEAARRGFRAGDPTAGLPSVAHLFDASRAGDPIARGVVAAAGSALGQALGQLCTYLAPSIVVIGGGVSHGFDQLQPTFIEALTEHVRVVPLPRVRLSRRPEIAGAIGAALWAAEADATSPLSLLGAS